MGNYPSLTPKEIEVIIFKLGYIFIRQKGSHRIYKKDKKLLVIPFHSKVLKSGTQISIIKSTGLTKEEFFNTK